MTTSAHDADVLAELAKAVDDRARPAEEGDEVGGRQATYVVSPGSTAEVAEVLRVAAQHDLATVVRGAGTKLHWGAAPERLDVLLDTERLGGVVEHNAGDLVVVVRAGTPLGQLQEVLGSAAQELAFDDPFSGAATVGGSVAVSPSGPRRVLRGTLRDLLIGVTFVRADGVVAKAGGKVVKNVAGYDFGKLLTGSFGTLGVITETVFRLHPRPAASRFVVADAPDATTAARLAHAAISSQTVPSAVEVDRSPDGGTVVAVLVEGTPEGVGSRAAALRELLGGAHADQPAWWGALPFPADGVGIKLTCSVGALGALLDAAVAAAAATGLPLHLRGSAAGVVHAGLPADVTPEAVASLVGRLRATAVADGGSVVVLTAPAPVRDAVDVWGPVPGLSLMRRLKDELDPSHLLAPGRFAGGI